MTRTPSPYSKQSIVFATMHGKERFAAHPFREAVGAEVVAPDHLDTDQLGTFAGDVPRLLSPRAAARVKARLGMQITGLPYGLASEGSFGSSLIGTETTEILLFVDAERGFELVERSSGATPLPPAQSVATIGSALDFARRIGFPAQGVLLRESRGPITVTHKDVTALSALAELVERGLDDGAALTVLPDHRAHRSPSRADRIRTLCDWMARRLATRCPGCATPGYGVVDVERDLPCSLCDAPTSTTAAEILGCPVCDHRERRTNSARRADPVECDRCNP